MKRLHRTADRPRWTSTDILLTASVVCAILAVVFFILEAQS